MRSTRQKARGRKLSNSSRAKRANFIKRDAAHHQKKEREFFDNIKQGKGAQFYILDLERYSSRKGLR